MMNGSTATGETMMDRDAKPSILVVEGENVVAMDLVSSLEKLRYHVTGVAASGEEAVALARSKRPGLVLMDIHLRGSFDGIHAAQQIQEDLFIPVVYLTAFSDEATLDRARVTHPFGYLIKPFEEREIEIAIQVAMFRREMENALRDSEKRLDAILSSIGEAVIATDTDRCITFINRAAEALLGWTSERAKGRLLSDILNGSSLGDGSLWLRRDQELVPVELVEAPVFDVNGNGAGHVTIARDISERRRAQEARDRALVERAARTAVEKEHERARLKSEISLVLGDITQYPETTTLQRVANLIARGFATWCVLHNEQGDEPVRISAHSNQEKIRGADEMVRRWLPNPTGPHGPYAVMRSGKPELLKTVSDESLIQLARDHEHLEALRKIGIKSWVCAPLRARQRVIGALTFLSTEADRHYDDVDLTFAQQVADRVALAVDNARLYREAHKARTDAEELYEAEQRARAEAEALLRIAESLTGAQLDVKALVQRVTDEATALVGADFGAFFYNVEDERGQSYMLYTLSGAPKEAFANFDLPRNTPIFEPTFSEERVVRIDDVRKDPRYGQMAPHYGMPEGHLPVASYLAVPVASRVGPVIGGLFFGHPEPGKFTEQHARMAKAVASHAAVAIDNARLFAETREAEERQSRLVRELERTVRFSEMFVGILGHDLRNPLSGITTAASLVLHRAGSDRVAKPVSRILSSADRMSRMIDQILDFTHVRLGRGIPLTRAPVDLADICRMVLDELKSEAEGGPGVRLELQGDLVGTWDGDRLAQLVSNLAGNAAQHRVPGTQVKLSVDGSRGERVILVVENEGVVPPEILPVIFEPMRRSGRYQSNPGSSGLGLGLYISQQIAVAHDGSIRAESEPNEGRTRFTVELPRAFADKAEQVFASSGGEESSE